MCSRNLILALIEECFYDCNSDPMIDSNGLVRYQTLHNGPGLSQMVSKPLFHSHLTLSLSSQLSCTQKPRSHHSRLPTSSCIHIPLIWHLTTCPRLPCLTLRLPLSYLVSPGWHMTRYGGDSRYSDTGSPQFSPHRHSVSPCVRGSLWSYMSFRHLLEDCTLLRCEISNLAGFSGFVKELGTFYMDAKEETLPLDGYLLTFHGGEGGIWVRPPEINTTHKPLKKTKNNMITT